MKFPSLIVMFILNCCWVVSGFDYCTLKCVTNPGEKHTMCEYPDTKLGSMCVEGNPIKLTIKQKQNILNTHNQLRSDVASGKEKLGPQPKAADMQKLSWNSELAKIATRWSLQCDVKHDACRNSKDNVNVGQNLAIYYSSDNNFDSHFDTVSAKDFYKEVKYFPPSQVSKLTSLNPTGKGTVAHYTQLVWGKTTHIGCGAIRYHDAGRDMSTVYLVCNYKPAGNMLEDKVYTVGNPCSSCPENCSLMYPGLCTDEVTGFHTEEHTSSNPAVKAKCSFFAFVILTLLYVL